MSRRPGSTIRQRSDLSPLIRSVSSAMTRWRASRRPTVAQQTMAQQAMAQKLIEIRVPPHAPQAVLYQDESQLGTTVSVPIPRHVSTRFLHATHGTIVVDASGPQVPKEEEEKEETPPPPRMSLLLGQHRQSRQWRFCRVWQQSPNGQLTVIWPDGKTQGRMDWEHNNLQLLSAELTDSVEREFSKPVRQRAMRIRILFLPSAVERQEYQIVWEAARAGDTRTVLEQLDQNELLRQAREPCSKYDQGRTLLYCASTNGHVDLVRGLLLRGTLDRQEEAQIEVDRRLQTCCSHQERQNWMLIRAMLATAAATPQSQPIRLPEQVYENAPQKQRQEQLSRECVVCSLSTELAIALPCGHVCACQDCLETIVRSSSSDCPLCRVPLVASIPYL